MAKAKHFSGSLIKSLRMPKYDSSVVLTADNLACVRGLQVVFAHLNFTVACGKVLHVSGANGAGKSSLLRTICGLLAPSTGTISLGDSTSVAANCHYLGHADGLKSTLTPSETIFYETRLWASGEPRSGKDLLAFVGLRQQADQPVASLSAGQRRRLALTRLLGTPRLVWLLDEPYTALDSAGRELVNTLIRSQTEAGGLVVLAAHEAVVLADQHLDLSA